LLTRCHQSFLLGDLNFINKTPTIIANITNSASNGRLSIISVAVAALDKYKEMNPLKLTSMQTTNAMTARINMYIRFLFISYPRPVFGCPFRCSSCGAASFIGAPDAWLFWSPHLHLTGCTSSTGDDSSFYVVIFWVG
jgi:hypothetical protein